MKEKQIYRAEKGIKVKAMKTEDEGRTEGGGKLR